MTAPVPTHVTAHYPPRWAASERRGTLVEYQGEAHLGAEVAAYCEAAPGGADGWLEAAVTRERNGWVLVATAVRDDAGARDELRRQRRCATYAEARAELVAWVERGRAHLAREL